MTVTCFPRTFEWLDDKKGNKKSTRVPAKQFIDSSLTQIHKQLQDERIFPTKFGPFLGEGGGEGEDSGWGLEC